MIYTETENPKRMRYTINDYSDIAEKGFEYIISDATLDIISALSAQVGAPDYIKTPNFNSGTRMMNDGRNTHHHTYKHNNQRMNTYGNSNDNGLDRFDDRGHNYRNNIGYHNNNHSNQGYSNHGGHGHGRRRRKAQEMSDDDWEDLRSFHSKPKAELSPDKIMEKRFRGELNRVVSGCNRSQIISISETINEMIEEDMGNIVERVFFDIATCSKINTNLFAELFVELVNYDDEVYELLSSGLLRFIQYGEYSNKEGEANWGWMSKFGDVEYINEDEDYDRFCDINKVNDKRLNVSRFIGKLFQTMFETEDSRFMWLDELSRCYIQMYNGFINVLEKENCEDVAMIYCVNIIEFIDPIMEYIDDLDSSYEIWNNVNEDMNEIIDNGKETYPSLSRQIVFALQGSNLI